MVCRTPGSFEVSPLRITEDNLDLRDLNASYSAPVLRLVSAQDDEVSDIDEALEIAPSYQDWELLSREAREQRVSAARSRRNAARRKQAKRAEKLVFHAAAATALIAAFGACIHVAVSSHYTPHNLVKVTIAPGDTLWAVASRYTPANDATANTVASIRLANPALTNQSRLRVGEKILVPTIHSS